LYRIERDDEEEYAIVYGRSCFQVVDLRNKVAANLEFVGDSQDYLLYDLPLASELRFVTIADTTIIANTKVATAVVEGSDGAEIDPATMPIRMTRIGKFPNLTFRIEQCEWKGRTFNTQVIVPGDPTESGFPTSFRITYKDSNTYAENGSTGDIPISAKASDPTAKDSTLRGGIEQYIAGNGKSPSDQDSGEAWKALTGLPSFPYGKVIVTGGPLSKGKRVYVRLSPDIEADELMTISGSPRLRVTRGDDDKNPAPTLVQQGLPITELGYHRNRLILASDELIAMSQADDIFNFYAEDETNIVDSDPIDVELAANDVTVIEHILPYRSTMLIMTKAGQQFELAASDVLGPNSINITPTTRYPAQPVRPIQQGDRVYFAGEGDQNSLIYEYFYADTTASSVAANITKHVESLLPSKVLTLTGAANSDTLYTLAVPDSPERVVMSSTEQSDGDWKDGTSWTIGEEPNPWDEIIIVAGDTVTAGLDEGNEGGIADGGSTIPDICFGTVCLPSTGGGGTGNPVDTDGDTGGGGGPDPPAGGGGGGGGGNYSDEDGITADGTIYAYRQYTVGNERKQSAWSRWTYFDDAIMDAITVDDELFTLRRETRNGTENWLLIERIDISDMVTATPGFPWRVHLDKMVTNVVGEYDETTNTTTWDIETGVPGYRVPDANSIVLLGPNGIVERRNTLITVDATGRYVSTAGNFAGVPTAIGRSFRSSVTLSPLYFRAEQPIDDGRTQIAKVIVTHANTGAYRVSVSNRNGQPTRYTNYSSGSIDTTGIVQAWVMGRNRDVTIRFETTDHRPCVWSSVEIHGLFGSHNSG
jgi:hypothetical protein